MKIEDFVKKALEQFGFTVQKIEEGENESPDFLVHDGERLYLLEVKSKETAEEILKSREEVL